MRACTEPGDYDADYYDDARVGKRHVERHSVHEIHYDNGRIDTVATYVDLNSLKNDSSFSGLRETAIDMDSSKVELVALPCILDQS